MNKKGISPVIATVLLITIALILAVIIFLWARNFIGEKVQKFGEPIENSCSEISFDADVSLSDGNLALDVVNKGNIPLYGIEVRMKEDGGVINIGSAGRTIANGQTEQFTLSDIYEDLDVGTELVLVPVIIGESGDMKKAYVCDQKFGLSRTI